ncbi:MAG: flagellar biosynthesis anti-sigma factor FlgM [Deltaproteobacteria bacterium]|nr:flagellar biosynthesis anti-sigma factor FlgM [Deltaproteobacteria bacterium]
MSVPKPPPPLSVFSSRLPELPLTLLLPPLKEGHLRTEKIARIREQIEQNTYHVPVEEVAKALLQTERFFLARGEKNCPRLVKLLDDKEEC